MAELHSKLADIVAEAVKVADNRAHRRVTVPLRVRYLLPDQTEYGGRILNISVGGALIEARPGATQGDKVILYIDELGRFDAEVLRIERDGFACRFIDRRARQKRIADTLTWLLNGGDKLLNRRSAKRIRQEKTATAYFKDGTQQPCIIVDVSTSGASLQIDPKPVIGSQFQIGQMMVRVVRHHDEGVGAEFISDKKIKQGAA